MEGHLDHHHHHGPFVKTLICKILGGLLKLSGFVVSGSNLKHTIYAFIIKVCTIFVIVLRKWRLKVNKKRPGLAHIFSPKRAIKFVKTLICKILADHFLSMNRFTKTLLSCLCFIYRLCPFLRCPFNRLEGLRRAIGIRDQHYKNTLLTQQILSKILIQFGCRHYLMMCLYRPLFLYVFSTLWVYNICSLKMWQ